QLRVTRNGVALGYSGDLCLEATLTAEKAEVVECDVLVLESTFGLPRYVFPPKDEVLLQIRRFVDDALSDGATPVLLGYALGKAQEILKYLGEAGYPRRAPTVARARAQCSARRRTSRGPPPSCASRGGGRPCSPAGQWTAGAASGAWKR